MNYTKSDLTLNVSADTVLSGFSIRTSFAVPIPRAGDSKLFFQRTRTYLWQHLLFTFPCTFPLICSSVYKGSNFKTGGKPPKACWVLCCFFIRMLQKMCFWDKGFLPSSWSKMNLQTSSLERVENHFPLVIVWKFPVMSSENLTWRVSELWSTWLSTAQEDMEVEGELGLLLSL